VSARDYLYSLEQIGIKLGLDQVRALLLALDRPDRTYPSIVVAGTNGKGSVSAMLERALRAAGYRTGLYTSPHLTDLEERFAVDGRSIAPEVLEQLAARVESAATALASPPSFFEATTALALEAFRRARVDVAVLEVGLGGRLDATNVVDPSRGHHCRGLRPRGLSGHTRSHRWREGRRHPRGLAHWREPAGCPRRAGRAAAAKQAWLIYAPEGVTAAATMAAGRTVVTIRTPKAEYGEMTLGLRGRHQIANAVVATRLLEELADVAVPETGPGRGVRLAVPATAIRAGLEDVSWPGRLEWRHWRGTDVIIDGAHNPAGARALAAHVQEVVVRGCCSSSVRWATSMSRACCRLWRQSHRVFSARRRIRGGRPPGAVAAVAREVAPSIPAEAVADPRR
jgi:dihydrofolate synthase/folylpolyglutamate synthase